MSKNPKLHIRLHRKYLLRANWGNISERGYVWLRGLETYKDVFCNWKISIRLDEIWNLFHAPWLVWTRISQVTKHPNPFSAKFSDCKTKLPDSKLVSEIWVGRHAAATNRCKTCSSENRQAWCFEMLRKDDAKLLANGALNKSRCLSSASRWSGFATTVKESPKRAKSVGLLCGSRLSEKTITRLVPCASKKTSRCNMEPRLYTLSVVALKFWNWITRYFVLSETWEN